MNYDQHLEGERCKQEILQISGNCKVQAESLKLYLKWENAGIG